LTPVDVSLMGRGVDPDSDWNKRCSAEIGDHARLAIGVAALPFNAPLQIESEVELALGDALRLDRAS
jgi:hypothetical protein